MRGADDMRWASGAGVRTLSLLAFAFPLLACGPGERTVAMGELQSKAPRERELGVRSLAKLGKPDDEELWVAVEKLARDPAIQVRVAVADSLRAAPKAEEREAAERGALADDALALGLSDLDDDVRIAAARSLGARCNARSIVYLQNAYPRGTAGVREQVAASLGSCGVPLEKVLATDEAERRRRALEKLGSNVPAWRIEAARELGLLGRAEDVAKIQPLIDGQDGALAAAAIEGIGFAADARSTSKLQKLAGEETPAISAAAIEALGELGPAALAGARPALEKQADAEGEQALPAALALLETSAAASSKGNCPVALGARVPAVAAVLAHGCPAAPFADAIAALVKGAKAPLAKELQLQVAPLLEGLAQAGRAQSAVPTLSPAQAKALGELCSLANGALAVRAAQVAQGLNAVVAGPAIEAVAQREKGRIDEAHAAEKAAQADRTAAMQTIESAHSPVQAADREKSERLMAMIRAHDARTGGQGMPSGPDAKARLNALLAESAAEENPLLAASLRAALALKAKGAPELAVLLADDPDPAVESAARGEPFPNIPQAAEAKASIGVTASPLSSLWSVDGKERAAACFQLATSTDPARVQQRAAFVHDPERRVRDACTRSGDTSSPASR